MPNQTSHATIMKAKLISISYSLAAAAGLAVSALSGHAQNVNVTGNLTYVAGAGDVFDYTLTLSNSGPEAVESLWLGWTVGNFDIASPTAAANSLGWSIFVDGNSIQFGGTAGTALASGGSATFTFDSTSTPAQFQAGTAGSSVAYGVNASQFAIENTTMDSEEFTPTIALTATSNSLPVITTQPQSQTVLTHTTVTLSVTASNATSYQWESNMVDLAGATNSSLILSNVVTADSATYRVVVSNTNSTNSVTSSNAVLLVLTILPPVITTEPQSTNALTNTLVTFSVTGSNAVFYQWESNMVDLAGETNASLILSNVVVGDSGNYQVVISNASGSVTSSVAVLVVGFPASITQEPTNSVSVLAGTPVTLQVEATGSPAPQYQWFLNSSSLPEQTNATLFLEAVTSNSAGTYSVTASNVFGSQTSSNAVLTVEPLSGIVKNKLTVTVNPAKSGAVSPNLNGKSLIVTHGYTVVAVAGKGKVFANWSGIVQSDDRSLTFIMPLVSNATLTANFIPSPFASNEVAGAYAGLFWDTNNLSNETSGYFSATVADSGVIAGQVKIAGVPTTFSTTLHADGSATLELKRHDLSTLVLTLQVDLTGSETLTGTVSDTNNTFNAQLTAFRAGFSASHPAANYEGYYTWAMPGAAGNAPAGYSYGTATIAAAGGVHLALFLSDGTTTTASGSLSTNGQMPLYVSLYGGKDALLSWLSFTNFSSILSTNTAFWFKGVVNVDPPPDPSPYRTSSPVTKDTYTDGFTLTNLTLLMGAYTAEAKGTDALDAPSVSVQLSAADLTNPISNTIALNSSGIGGSSASTAMNLSDKTGLFSGSFKDPTSGKTVHFNGAILRSLPAGYGFFTSGGLSGAVVIDPQ
jgi:hypothetical protein